MSELNEKLDVIRRNMYSVREQLTDEVDDAIQQAKEVVDWRNYVRDHPLASFGVASAIGYLLVPKRHQHVTVLQADGADVRRALKEQRDADKPTLASMAVSALSALAFRKAVSVAQSKAESWLTPAQAGTQSAAASSSANARPAGSRGNGNHFQQRREQS